MPISDPAALRVPTERLVLALPGPEAAERVLAYHLENRAYLQAWEPPRPDATFTLEWHMEKLARDRQDVLDDRALRLYLFPRETGVEGPALGLVNFSQIYRAPLWACVLGYSLAEKAQGQGLITEALRAAIELVWDTLELHRIEASYVPTNDRSGRVLKRLGFVVEGYARDYLFTGGAWRDHIRTSLTNPRFVSPW